MFRVKKFSNCNYKLVIFVMKITFLELVVCHLSMYCVNLAETSHTHRSIINVYLKHSII